MMYFTADEERQIQEAVERVETRTGVQILTAVIGKADHYPEAPWKAFALGASLTALLLTVQAFLDPPWIVPLHAALYTVAVLGVGAAAVLVTTLWPALARRFVPSGRTEGEVEQYARALFLERELFRTRERIGVLILVSLFERRVFLLPDSGVAARLGEGDSAAVVRRMTPHLARGARFQALSEGLEALEAALFSAGFRGTPGAPDEIPEEFVQEKGVEE